MSGWGRFRAVLIGGVAVAIVASAAPASQVDSPRSLTKDFVRPALTGPQGEYSTVGNKQRVLLLCAFTGSPSPSTKQLAYFEEMFKDPEEGLLAYFDEASYGRIHMTERIEDWKTLPQSYDTYYNDANKDHLFDDCLAAHDSAVNFNNYDAIDIITNDTLGTASLGGVHCGTVEGSFRCPPITMVGSKDGTQADDRSLWAHEMGHSLNLPHTSGTSGSHYWDPMGFPAGWCFVSGSYDNDYFCEPTHYLAAHKDRKMMNVPGFGKQPFGLGWITKDRRFIARKGSSTKVTLERLAKPRNNDNPLIARIPVAGKPFYYAVESRIRVGHFDGKDNLPGDGVIVSKVDWKCDSCGAYFPVLVIGDDKKDRNGDPGADGLIDPGSAMWKPGETFHENGIKIAVLSMDGDNAYKVRITVPD